MQSLNKKEIISSKAAARNLLRNALIFVAKRSIYRSVYVILRRFQGTEDSVWLESPPFHYRRRR